MFHCIKLRETPCLTPLNPAYRRQVRVPIEPQNMLEKEDLTEQILNCAFKVHSKLGPGLLESAYQACLKYELEKLGLGVKSEVPVPLIYEDIRLECGYRIDLLIDDQVVVELKTVDQITDVHKAQILTYLKFSGYRVGLLLNFKTKSLVKGIHRFIL